MTMPVPVDPSVLTLQATHRSLAAWEGSTTQLVTRQHYQASTLHWQVDDRVLEVVELAGFSYIHRLLVERWRPETHTFHLTVGEATITLQDVAVILGLSIEGQTVIGHGEGHWPALVLELLGVLPENPQDPTETKIITRSSLKLTWLREHFSVLEDNADDITVERYAHGYILYLFGCILFPDKSGDLVQLIYLPLLEDLERLNEYSWGNMVMGAYSYKEAYHSDDLTRWFEMLGCANFNPLGSEGTRIRVFLGLCSNYQIYVCVFHDFEMLGYIS
ncbi:protein MAIN-LIKE 1-like [Amaranthus tricolor]|uniref:protein MAIN-LIKE 1-like n=1 Tax=Amaranthus tricolor TaxID=29722 RepID=UPI002590D8EF|nr:protein MAIN-LIKE 1-like [Amaranthus tricolor]